MGLHSAARRLTPEEWQELSALVFNRDGWVCLAPKLDPQAGVCRDREGRPFRQMGPVNPRRVREYLTLQHVQLGGKTDNDFKHLLSLCWGHHLGTGEKGGRIWSKQSAAARLQRKYLIDRYPEVAA